MPSCATAWGPEEIGTSLDLTGEWEGTFSYPGGKAATPFHARIQEHCGTFEGTTMEPDLYRPLDMISARIVGDRDGRSVDFTKTYIDPVQGYENAVVYVGQLSDRGDVVTGMWSLLGMRGSFEMRRETRAVQYEEAETVETVPAS